MKDFPEIMLELGIADDYELPSYIKKQMGKEGA